MDKQIIIDGGEFQSYCIEYKDISYLKIMPICAIHELSIACHDKVNKCKYYKLYKQIQAKEQECEKFKNCLTEIKEIAKPFCNACQEFEPKKRSSNCMYCNYGKILQKISECEANQ